MTDKKYACETAGGLTRRRMLQLGAGAAAGFVALGPDAIAFAQSEDNILRVVHNAYTQDWSPLRGGGSHYMVNSLWWASAMYFDIDGNVQPYVMDSWDSNEDDSVWTFTVSPDAVFSDGSKITAQDVIGSWSLAAMPGTRNQRVNQALSKVVGYDAVSSGEEADISGLVAVDDATVEVTLDGSDPLFFMRVANHIVPITKVSQSRGEDGNEVADWFTPDAGAVYSGPFKLTSIDLDAGKLVFEANENFFLATPGLAGITIDTVDDDIAAMQLIKSREFLARTSGLAVPNVAEELGQAFVDGPEVPLGQHYWFNATRAPMDDINVRKALIMAVDRDGLIEASFPTGPHPKADQILNAVPGAEDSGFEPYPFDPEAARAALAESSYGGPENLPRIMFVGIGNVSNQIAAQYIAEQWRQNLGITAVEMKPQVDAYSGPDQNAIQIFRDDVSSPVPDAVSYLEGAIASTSGNATRKMGGYKNEEIDAMLAEASLLSLDDPRRIELAQEAQRMFREEYMFLPWYHQIAGRAAVAPVKNIESNLTRQIARPWAIVIEDEA